MSYFNRNQWTTIAFLLLIALNIISLSTLWIMHERETGRPAGNQPALVDFLVAELGLDSVQKKQLIVLRDEHRQNMQTIRRKNRDAKNAFFDLLQEDISDTALAAAAKEAARYDAETDMLTFRHFQQIRALCNAEQKIKFESVIRQVLRMMAPPLPGRPQGGPPPPGRDGEKQDGPPPGEEGQAPPPPHQ